MQPKFETIGEIKLGNTFYAHKGSSAIDIASELLHSRFSGMPVIDEKNRVVGVVSQEDLLRALRSPRSLEEVAVGEIMNPIPIVVEEETTLEEASKIMEKAHIHRLPVVREGVLIGTVTRRDLMRAWLGMSVDV
jgi:CBS domain-containing protein